MATQVRKVLGVVALLIAAVVLGLTIGANYLVPVHTVTVTMTLPAVECVGPAIVVS